MRAFEGYRLLAAIGIACLLASCGGAPGHGAPNAMSQLIAPPAMPAQPQSFMQTLGSGPYHITTWAYDFSSGRGSSAPAASVRQLVDYAEGDQKALNDCRGSACKSVFYFDAGHETAVTPGCNYQPDELVIAAASESWFLHVPGHTDAAHRVHGQWPNHCTVYAMNPNSTGLQNWFRTYLQRNAANFDLYLSDLDSLDIADTGWFTSHGGCDPWPHICSAFHEIGSDAAMIAARINFIKAMRRSNGTFMDAFYQQAHIQDPGYDVTAFAGAPNFVGATCEGCVAGLGANPVAPARYAQVLDEMAVINRLPKGSFVLLSAGDYPAGSPNQLLQRAASIGVTWLGYSQGHTVAWPDMENSTNRLAIWPEDLIYPSGPLQTMVTGAHNLEVVTGVYRREFTTCYYKSVAFGHCAAIVNSNAYSVTVRGAWFRQAYGHIITLQGGDVVSGAVADIDGAKFVSGSTRLASGEALLLSR